MGKFCQFLIELSVFDTAVAEYYCLMFFYLLFYYRNNPKYWDRQAFANSVDPDKTMQSAASEQGLHCLPYIQQYFKHINRKKNGLFQILGQVW